MQGWGLARWQRRDFWVAITRLTGLNIFLGGNYATPGGFGATLQFRDLVAYFLRWQIRDFWSKYNRYVLKLCHIATCKKWYRYNRYMQVANARLVRSDINITGISRWQIRDFRWLRRDFAISGLGLVFQQVVISGLCPPGFHYLSKNWQPGCYNSKFNRKSRGCSQDRLDVGFQVASSRLCNLETRSS